MEEEVRPSCSNIIFVNIYVYCAVDAIQDLCALEARYKTIRYYDCPECLFTFTIIRPLWMDGVDDLNIIHIYVLMDIISLIIIWYCYETQKENRKGLRWWVLLRGNNQMSNYMYVFMFCMYGESTAMCTWTIKIHGCGVFCIFSG